jgi:lysophospholipase L1-like esterase
MRRFVDTSAQCDKTRYVRARPSWLVLSAAFGIALSASLLAPGSRVSAQPVAGRVPSTAVITGPELTPALRQLRAQAQARILGVGSEIEDAAGNVRVLPSTKSGGRENGNGLGTFVPIENESALNAFHVALAELKLGRLPGGKLRILAYGASHTQGDVYTSYLRYYLQSRFGNGGPGFVQAAKLDKRYHRLDLQIDSSGYAIQHAQLNAAPARGWFGLLGAAAIANSPAAHASISHGSARRSEMGAVDVAVYAMGEPTAGGLRLLIDGKPQASWSTKSPVPKLVVQRASSPNGFSQLSVKPAGDGSVRLFGVSVERQTPGIVVDTLGISGTRAANWLQWDEASWAEQVQLRHPYLITLAYGTNETSDEHQPIERYERDLDLVLARIRRAAPQASCLLIGPADVAKKRKGAWIRRSRLGPIIDVQRRQAQAHGCGFWDTRRFMGKGGIARWMRATPSMASTDHVHLTRRGYVKLGMGLGDALLRAYDEKRRIARY